MAGFVSAKAGLYFNYNSDLSLHDLGSQLNANLASPNQVTPQLSFSHDWVLVGHN